MKSLIMLLLAGLFMYISFKMMVFAFKVGFMVVSILLLCGFVYYLYRFYHVQTFGRVILIPHTTYRIKHTPNKGAVTKYTPKNHNHP